MENVKSPLRPLSREYTIVLLCISCYMTRFRVKWYSRSTSSQIVVFYCCHEFAYQADNFGIHINQGLHEFQILVLILISGKTCRVIFKIPLVTLDSLSSLSQEFAYFTSMTSWHLNKQDSNESHFLATTNIQEMFKCGLEINSLVKL